MSFFASRHASALALLGAATISLVACGSSVTDTSSATGAANGAGSGGATATSTGTGGAAQGTGGAPQNTGGAAPGTGGAAGAGGTDIPTCTVTNTVIALPEGSPCGVPSGDPCDPGSMCMNGTYCAGSDCAQTIAGVCTKLPVDCATAGGPAVRDCYGKCYENGCYAANMLATFVEDDTCAVAGAGGAGGGG